MHVRRARHTRGVCGEGRCAVFVFVFVPHTNTNTPTSPGAAMVRIKLNRFKFQPFDKNLTTLFLFCRCAARRAHLGVPEPQNARPAPPVNARWCPFAIVETKLPLRATGKNMLILPHDPRF